MYSKISNEIPLGSRNKFSIYILSPISSSLTENFIEINTFQQKKSRCFDEFVFVCDDVLFEFT